MWIMFTKQPEFEDIFVKIDDKNILDNLYFREDIKIEFLFKSPRKGAMIRIYWREK